MWDTHIIKIKGNLRKTGKFHTYLQIIIPSKKEMFQPHLPVRLPCYDLAPVIGFALGRSFVHLLSIHYTLWIYLLAIEIFLLAL